MADQTAAYARVLVKTLYHATEGKPVWWPLPHDINEPTKRALQYAVEQGWLLVEGRDVRLTKTGQVLAEPSPARRTH